MTGRMAIPGWFSSRSRLERKAVHAFRLKDYRGAIRHLDALLAHVGENPNTLHVLAFCHERIGDEDAAFEYATRAVSADEHHFEALRLLVRLHVHRGEEDDARAFTQRALSSLPPPTAPRSLVRAARLFARDRDPSLDGYDRELREWIHWARALVGSDTR
ncbi:MAG: tetratricopeptide repeat protein [Thiotrichales bacterium]|nr:tetratricopeptide repeat protein [Thiotrichales bacterium]MCY4286357.1 tetratricopeptide repeat protein [Thiotrichales bacterium]MCY4350758.1 tetratricopeptide repeat protein [Thiotrichales bacterium]